MMPEPEDRVPRIYRKNGLPAHELHKYDRDTGWLDQALCVNTPIIWWAPPFATRSDSKMQKTPWTPDPRAYALCKACPVKADCLYDANRSGDIDWSMRAGQGPRAYQRRQEKSARERQARKERSKKALPPPPGGCVAVLKNFKRRDAT